MIRKLYQANPQGYHTCKKWLGYSLLTLAIAMMIIAPRAIAVMPLLTMIFFIGRTWYLGHLNKASLAGAFAAPLSKHVWIFLAIFSALVSVGLLWAVEPGESFERFYKLLLLLIPSACAVTLRPLAYPTLPQYFVPSIFFGILMGVLYLLIQYASGMIFFRPFYGAGNAPFEPTGARLNRGSSVLLLLAVLVMPFLKRDHKFILGLATFSVWMLTDSQSMQLALVVAVLFYVGFPAHFDAARKAFWALFAFVVLIAPLFAQLAFFEFSSTMQDNSWLRQGYALQRLEIWDFTAKKIAERPWTGHGIEAMRSIKDFDSQALYHKDTHALHPHNFALQIWLEFGALGVCALYFMLWRSLDLIGCLRRPYTQSAMAFLVAFFGIASTAFGFWQSWWVALLPLSCLLFTMLYSDATDDRGTRAQ